MALKTSTSHPLQIDSVRVAGNKGRIGMTFCPGKHQPDAVSGAWARDLALDLDVISTWGARALVCLVQQHELEQLRVAKLAQAARAAGLEFHHLPIRDADIPQHPFEALWLWSGLRLRTLLNNGEDVVVHCKGGLGRTGLVAARLLIDFGEEPDQAVQRIRSARDGAIETNAQLHWVMQQRPDTTDAEPMLSPSDRALGCIIGGAVGDALGYCVEFDRWAAIESSHGPHGIRAPIATTSAGEAHYVVSDDTQMTLFTLEALIAAANDAVLDNTAAVISRIRESMLRWLSTQQATSPAYGQHQSRLLDHASLFVRRAPGNTCLDALQSGGHGTPTNIINASKGCGGVMRVAPLGLLPQRIDTARAFELGAHAAAVTHTHPSGYIASGAMSAIICELMSGETLLNAVARANSLARHWTHHEETTRAIDTAMNTAIAADDNQHPASIAATLGEGWVAEEALAIALYAVRAGNDFAHVLRIAANHNGDSDSTASIAGQIYGAMKGAGELPHEWADALDVRDAALEEMRVLLSL